MDKDINFSGHVNLSKRLKAICNMVTPGERVCDVGCDHGYVSCYLVMNNIAPSALAMDINKGPLNKASENVKHYGLGEKIELRLSDGLSKYNIGEADSLIIAGMGGLLIRRILENNIDNTRDFKEMILSPQSEVGEVRIFLPQIGYTIIDEDMVLEDGQYYPIIKAQKADEVHAGNCNKQGKEVLQKKGREAEDGVLEALPQEALNEFGPILIKKKHPVLIDYLEWRLSRHNDVLCKLKSNNTDLSDRIGELSNQVAVIEEVLKIIKEA